MKNLAADRWAGFSDPERNALTRVSEFIPVEKFHTLSADYWLKYRGVGKRFIERLRARGWVAEPWPDIGLSTRALNILNNAEIDPTRDGILKAFEAGRITFRRGKKLRGLGKGTYEELRRIAGLPNKVPSAVKVQVFCLENIGDNTYRVVEVKPGEFPKGTTIHAGMEIKLGEGGGIIVH